MQGNNEEEKKAQALQEVKEFFTSLVSSYGEEVSKWALRKKLDLESNKASLLKKKVKLEEQLAEINSQL